MIGDATELIYFQTTLDDEDNAIGLDINVKVRNW